MRRIRFPSTDSEHMAKIRRNRIWYILGAVFFILVLVGAALAIWLPRRTKEEDAQCRAISSDADRFDCHPDRTPTEDSCLSRGCCFRPASDLSVKDGDLLNSRFVGVPSCFFPAGYSGYAFQKNGTANGNEMDVVFGRTRPSGFPDDVKEVRVVVTPIDDRRLRIQIKDNNVSRFEPDVPISYAETGNYDSQTYSVVLGDNKVLEVKRKNSKQIVFSTDLSKLIFSNFFLQLTTTVASQYVYGLGEQKESMLKSNFNWQRYTIFNQGDLPVPNRNLYGSHPFFLVMDPKLKESYGVFLLNSNAMDYILQPSPAITIRPVGGIFDFFLLLGPSPSEVVSQYTALFGQPNFPPRWSLGFQICKYGYFSLNKTEEILKRNLDADIPIDVQWHDIDYMQNHLDFTFDPTNFTNLPKFVEKLHSDGRHYVAMISPGLSNTEKPGKYKPYDDAVKLDLFVKKDDTGKPIQGKVWNENYTVFPDFSHPKTADYWKEQFKTFHKQLDFDGVWLDMNEPLNFFNGSVPGDECPESIYDNPPYVPGHPYPLKTLTICMSSNHHSTKHYNEHNLLAYRESKATHEAMVEITGKRPFIISRATFAGQGVYSGHWSGDITSDWDDLKYTISTLLTFSLYGIPMTGSDICGFRQNTTVELCSRWQALGAFYPFSRNHNDYDTVEQDPAAMGKNVIESTKKALHIRYKFIPYLYTLFYKNHIKGETVARPLFFEFPEDEKTYAIEDQFLLGPALHIMPALNPGIKSINPYIPKGVWYDLEGKLYKTDGQKMTFPAEETNINVLLRGGYILPTQQPDKTVSTSALKPFDVLVALNSDMKAEGEFFWDDGEKIDTIKSEKYIYVKMSADKNMVEITPEKTSYEGQTSLSSIKVYGLTVDPKTVTINSKEATHTFQNNILTIDTPGYSLVNNLTVTWT